MIVATTSMIPVEIRSVRRAGALPALLTTERQCQLVGVPAENAALAARMIAHARTAAQLAPRAATLFGLALEPSASEWSNETGQSRTADWVITRSVRLLATPQAILAAGLAYAIPRLAPVIDAAVRERLTVRYGGKALTFALDHARLAPPDLGRVPAEPEALAVLGRWLIACRLGSVDPTAAEWVTSGTGAPVVLIHSEPAIAIVDAVEAEFESGRPGQTVSARNAA